jgi:hypothetical protein
LGKSGCLSQDQYSPHASSTAKGFAMMFPQSWLAKGVENQARNDQKYRNYCNISPTTEVMSVPEDNAVRET